MPSEFQQACVSVAPICRVSTAEGGGGGVWLTRNDKLIPFTTSSQRKISEDEKDEFLSYNLQMSFWGEFVNL